MATNSEPLALLRPAAALPVVAGVWCACLVALAVYRLYFHPLAKFPGPKLAALSKWYEFYYEVVLKGQFTFRIDDMHKKYGPIVRITPFEVHVKDSTYWEELYAKNAKADKYEWMNGRFGNNGSVFTTHDAATHRIRRGALNPMFSRRAILNYEPILQDKVRLLCKQLTQAVKTGKPINFLMGFSSFAGDVITDYCFGFGYDHLKNPGFVPNFHAAFMAVSAMGHLALQYPIIHPILNLIPDHVNEKMNPALATLLRLQKDLRRKIANLASEHQKSKNGVPTIFQEILRSNIPAEEKANRRLADEAQTVIGAGLETTAWAMTHVLFFIASNPTIAAKLRKELKSVLPTLETQPDWMELEKLPYLTACIREGIRLGLGVSARNPRVMQKPIAYKDWTVPPGTPISMTIFDVHHDERIFPDSNEFIPERWLDNPTTKDGEPLEKYFVVFGKGTRSCLGINLAYAELYMLLGTIFRRYDFELYETDRSDIDLKHDFFLPSPKLDSVGVQCTVKFADF